MSHQYFDDFKLLKEKKVFDITYGTSLEFKNIEGHKCRSVKREKPGRIVLNISTFIGSINAIHYYGMLTVYDLSFTDLKTNKTHSTCGYGDHLKPKEMLGLDIRLHRKLTQAEIDDDPERWKCMIAGYWTECFITEKDVIRKAKQIVKKCFTSDWKLEIQ